MRFYTDVNSMPSKHMLLKEIIHHPHVSFANDFIYFTLEHHGQRWIPYKIPLESQVLPPGSMYHCIHPLSPFTKNLQEATRLIFNDIGDDCKAEFKNLVPEGAEDKLARFVDAVHHMNEHFLSHYESVFLAIYYLVSLGRLTVAFYAQGITDAAHIAPALISGLLWKLETLCPKLFTKLDHCASNIVVLFEKREEKC